MTHRNNIRYRNICSLYMIKNKKGIKNYNSFKLIKNNCQKVNNNKKRLKNNEGIKRLNKKK